ncbi:hypothetical protein BDZ89DRAFT_1151770 [Hymenopellis radicata]|nr:hypothetical protein BDZ89DRAFT_1151770 [Hymenopellis radicata]
MEPGGLEIGIKGDGIRLEPIIPSLPFFPPPLVLFGSSWPYFTSHSHDFFLPLSLFVSSSPPVSPTCPRRVYNVTDIVIVTVPCLSAFCTLIVSVRCLARRGRHPRASLICELLYVERVVGDSLCAWTIPIAAILGTSPGRRQLLRATLPARLIPSLTLSPMTIKLRYWIVQTMDAFFYIAGAARDVVFATRPFPIWLRAGGKATTTRLRRIQTTAMLFDTALNIARTGVFTANSEGYAFGPRFKDASRLDGDDTIDSLYGVWTTSLSWLVCDVFEPTQESTTTATLLVGQLSYIVSIWTCRA